MPQIIAIFTTVLWLGLAVIGVIKWYWALAGWFVTGPIYAGVRKILSKQK
jgi:hypothetical protein